MGYIGNQAVQGYSSIPAKQDLTGATGGTLTLTHAVASSEAIDLYINNVRQEPTESYSVAGTTVTLNGYTVAATDDIYVVYNALALQTSVPPDGSVTMDKLATSGTLPALNGSALTGLAVANRNLIINGAMTVAQRGTSGTITGDNQFPSLDRWGTRTYGGTGAFSVAQDTTVPSGQTFTNSLKATVTTTTTSGTYGYAIKQNLEGYTVNQLRTGTSDALKSTLSFWARSSVAGTYCCSVRGTAGAASYVFEYTLAANTWTKIEHTIAEPTTTTPSWNRTNAADYLIEWSLGGQTSKQTSTTESWHDGNYTSTSNQTDWIATSGATFYLTGVQLEVGEQATPFEHEDYGTTLRKCQRFLYMLDTTSSAGDENTPVFREGATAAQLTYYLPTNLRATPSIVGSNYGRVVGYNTSFSVAAVTVSAMAVRTNINDGQKIDVNLTHASLAGSYVFAHHDRASTAGTLAFDAEL